MSLFSFLASYAQTPIIIEKFDETVPFTTRWTVTDANSSGKQWSRTTATSYDGTAGIVLCATSGTTSGVNSYMTLQTPLSLQAGEHFVSFRVQAFSRNFNEVLKISYGTTTNPAEWTNVIYTNSSINYQGYWNFQFANFNIASAGDYYFAVQVLSPAAASGIRFDDLTIGSGTFTGSPDIRMDKVTLPYSSCELGDNSVIKYSLSNIGTLSTANFDLIYRVNGSVQNTINRTITLNAGEIYKDSILGSIGNFLVEGIYNIEIVASVTGDVNNNNDTARATVIHYEPLPIDSLPYSYAFKLTNRKNADKWFPMDPTKWTLSDTEGWKVNGTGSLPALVSNCFNLVPNIYKITVIFKAGSAPNTETFKILYGETATDIASWSTISEVIINTNNLYETHVFTIEITQADSYTFGLLPTVSKNKLAFSDITIEVNQSNDLFVEYASYEPVYNTYPIEHTNFNFPFSATIQNVGNMEALNAKVSILGKDSVVLAVSSPHTIPSGGTQIINVESPISSFGVGDVAKIIVKASMDAVDDVITNNYKDFTFNVSDSTLILDMGMTDPHNINFGIAAGSKFGNVYKLNASDTLTSVTIGWATGTSMPFGLSLYSVDTVNNNLVPGTKYFEIQANRPAGDSLFVNYPVPARVLQPGSYFLQIEQLVAGNLSVAGDFMNGIYFEVQGGQFTWTTGMGYIVARMNFGHGYVVAGNDAQTISIFEPSVHGGIFTSNELVKATVKNNGANFINNLSVYCKVDNGVAVEGIIPRIEPYKTANVEFYVDLSGVGTHNIFVYPALENDENLNNDTLVMTIDNQEPLSLYSINFEGCETFAIDHFNPAWRAVNANGNKVGLFTPDFPHNNTVFGFLVMDPTMTTPPTNQVTYNNYPYDGTRYLASYRKEMPNVSDDWFISPKLLLGTQSKFQFRARSLLQVGSLDLERFNVMISTTNDDLSSFTRIGSGYSAPTSWTLYNIDLAAYNNQEVYLAIQCVSTNSSIFMLDAIEVLTNLLDVNTELADDISIYPNPMKDFLRIKTSSLEIQQVAIYNAIGKLIYQVNDINANEYNLNTDKLVNGIYFVQVKTANGVHTKKVVK